MYVLAPQKDTFKDHLFCNSPLKVFIPIFSSQQCWLLPFCSTELSVQYMIQMDNFFFLAFQTHGLSLAQHISSLFCFSFCSLEPSFLLFIYTHYSYCKHLLICNVLSETDYFFLSASSIHSLFSNHNQKHRFFFFLCIFFSLMDL